MNKETAITKINKIGKAGHIIAIIIQVILGIGAVLLLIASILLIACPKDFLTVETNTQVNALVNLNKLPGITDENLRDMEETLQKETENGSLSVNNNTMAVAGITVDNGVMNVETEVSTSNFSINNVGYVCISALLQIICAFISVFFVGKLCKSIKTCASPFDESIISGLKKVAFSLIPLAIFDSITNSVFSAFSSGKASVSLSINLVVVFAILIIFALSYIFKYGAELQKESDETL